MEIKVLIADDHTIVRDGLKLILESQNDMKVVAVAEDGLQVINKVRDTNPDVILMDIAMPNMNGIEAARRIIEESPSSKIVILSMHSTLEDIFRSLQTGAMGYLLKESAGTEIIDAVRAAFNGRRYLSRKVDDILIDSYIYEHQIKKTESPLEKLSQREREVLQLVAEGKSSNDISELLFLSVKTVETYRSRLMQKLGIKDITALVKFAMQQGLTR